MARAGPVIRPAANAIARKWTMDMLAFYTAWHLCGGFDGFQEAFGMHPSTIWRKVAKFRRIFSVHPDEATFAGVTINREAFWESSIAEANLSESSEG